MPALRALVVQQAGIPVVSDLGDPDLAGVRDVLEVLDDTLLGVVRGGVSLEHRVALVDQQVETGSDAEHGESQNLAVLVFEELVAAPHEVVEDLQRGPVPLDEEPLVRHVELAPVEQFVYVDDLGVAHLRVASEDAEREAQEVALELIVQLDRDAAAAGCPVVVERVARGVEGSNGSGLLRGVHWVYPFCQGESPWEVMTTWVL